MKNSLNDIPRILHFEKETVSKPIKIIPNYHNKYIGKSKPEPFTGLSEEWWKENN